MTGYLLEILFSGLLEESLTVFVDTNKSFLVWLQPLLVAFIPRISR